MLGWVLVLLLCSGSVPAQDAVTGALRGVVTDATGALVGGARVLLRSVANASQSEQMTGEAGEFYLPQVAPGEYVVTVTAAGFAAADLRAAVRLGETLVLAVKLRPGRVVAAVLVNAQEEASLDTLEPMANQTLTPQELDDLPLDGRRWSSFALLTPLVTADDEAYPQMSVRGVAPEQNRFVLDGVTDTQSFLGVPRGGIRADFIVPQSAVQEFRITASDAGVELGGVSGVVTTVTRRGGDRLHGSAFLQARENHFAAANPFSVATRYNNGSPTSVAVKPQDLRLQWGATAGGLVPRLRAKVFYFASYEQQRRSFPALATPSVTNFFNLSATQTALLQTRGVTVPQIRSGLQYLDSLLGQVPRRGDEVALLSRLDTARRERNRFALEWNHARWNSPAGALGEAVVHRAVSSLGNDATHSDAVIARWTYAATPLLHNEVSASYSGDLETQTAQTPLPQEPHSSASSGSNALSPQVNIAGELSLGTPSSLGGRRYPNEQRWEFADTLSWAWRYSLLQVGFSASRVNEHLETLRNAAGTYNYSDASGMGSAAIPGNGKAGGLVDFLTDYTFSATAYPNGACPSIYAAVHYFCFTSYTQGIGQSVTEFNLGEYAAFMKYHWRPTDTVTIDAGLRYEYVAMPAAQHPNSALDAVFGDFASTSVLPADTNNLQPRIGLAWSVTPKTAVRAGFGVSFGRVTGAAIRSALANTAQPLSTYTLRLGPKTIVDAQCASAGSNFGYPAAYACVPSGVALKTSAAMAFTRRFQLPMAENASLTVEHEIAKTVLSLGYSGAASRELPNSTDINVAPSISTAAFRVVRPNGGGEVGARDGDVFSVPLYTARVSSAFGAVTAIESNASASYHALIAQATRRLQRGVQVRVAWTFAKMLDYDASGHVGGGQSQDATPRGNGQFDPFDVRYDRAASSLDRRQKVVASGVWQPVFSLSQRAERFANGWSLAPSFSAVSGRPYSYEILGGPQLNGGRQSINGSGGARYLPSVGRNTQRLPWVEVLDLRLARRFAVTERVSARALVDAFNLMNHVNYTGVQQRAFLAGAAVGGVTPLVFQDAATIAAEGLQTRAFGQFSSAESANARERRLQFGVRVEW